MKIYDANGQCWIWNNERLTLQLEGDTKAQVFYSVISALYWLNRNGYMEKDSTKEVA
jgi:hypothetical protein